MTPRSYCRVRTCRKQNSGSYGCMMRIAARQFEVVEEVVRNEITAKVNDIHDILVEAVIPLSACVQLRSNSSPTQRRHGFWSPKPCSQARVGGLDKVLCTHAQRLHNPKGHECRASHTAKMLVMTLHGPVPVTIFPYLSTLCGYTSDYSRAGFIECNAHWAVDATTIAAGSKIACTVEIPYP